MVNTSDKFEATKILAGKKIFQTMALQRTSKVFGITNTPWAAAAFEINRLVVQMETKLRSWDTLEINKVGKTRLIRDNVVIYELQIRISPQNTGLTSDSFYYCSTCRDHIFRCSCLVSQRQSVKQRSVLDQQPILHCPQCQGKVQGLGGNLYFCLDCKWESDTFDQL